LPSLGTKSFDCTLQWSQHMHAVSQAVNNGRD
jgi:hypothetical protein